MNGLRRVRYAPSPTGELHLGGLRTALFNWLFARQGPAGSKFLVRIEDTDRTRRVDGAEDRLLKALEKFGLGPDENVVTQSTRKDLHAEHAHRLVTSGSAYPCFCSQERLAKVRGSARSEGGVTGPTVSYDRLCRHVDPQEAQQRIAQGESHTIRLKAPLEGFTIVDDLVHGEVAFSNSVVDDQILLKSDGFPTYHLASVVDDHDMDITHVIRGEEWLSSTPKHLMLYDAFGWKPPAFAHLPLLLNADGTKLSKRNKGASVDELLATLEYETSSVLNFVALLGWSGRQYKGLEESSENHLALEKPEESEEEEKRKLVFKDLASLVEAFDLRCATRKGAVVDLDFLYWLNGEHVRGLERSELIREAQLQLGGAPNAMFTDDYVNQVLDLVLSRVFRRSDIGPLTRPFLTLAPMDLTYCEEDMKNAFESCPIPEHVLPLCKEVFSTVTEEEWTADVLRGVLKQLPKKVSAAYEKQCGVKTKLKPSHVMLPVRWAATGSLKGAMLPETLHLLGRSRVIERVSYVI